MNVSVIIPVYNAERYVREAVDSALSQPETSEVILVEDGSLDNSLQICIDVESQNSKVKVLRHQYGQNRGASASRNLGIKKATCDYIAFLDADDFYLSGRFSTLKKIFENNPEVDGVYEAIGARFENETVREEWFRRNPSDITTLKEKIAPENLFPILVNAENKIGHFHLNGLVVRKYVFDKVGFFDEHIKLVEDTHMCIRMSAIVRLIPGRLEEPVSIRRLHGDNSILGPMWHKRRHHIVLMWKRLFDWSIVNGLYSYKIDLIADSYLSAGERGCGDNQILARGLLRWEILAEVFRKHPKAITKKYYWRHVIRACDITKLRYFLTGVPET